VPVGNLAKPKFPKWAAKMGTMACTQYRPYHNDFHAFHPFCYGFGFSWASLELAHHQVFFVNNSTEGCPFVNLKFWNVKCLWGCWASQIFEMDNTMALNLPHSMTYHSKVPPGGFSTKLFYF